ncbi:MAG TPA: hypothetical protein PLE81_02090 [Brevundimonas sp.]|jgi:hypothetical protein|uniref:hypothetical protein n=1 Tax=Brevundimonas sp. TaxID=1871086 RepID=UPI002BC47941|nr:hypothetical protein [Brevundimonas sp.]HRH19405.1 hypothetical protein [Brevundimonas sp.]
MRVKIFGILIAGLAVIGCSPDASSQYPDGQEPAAAPAGESDASGGVAGPAAPQLNSEVAADDPIRLAVIGPTNTNLSEQAGRSVVINPEIMRSEGEWVFVYGPVRNIDGSPIDWSTTPLADAAVNGTMDGDVAVVLLNWDGLDWRVVEAVIGATDVPQGGWPAEHHVSPGLVGMEGG